MEYFARCGHLDQRIDWPSCGESLPNHYFKHKKALMMFENVRQIFQLDSKLDHVRLIVQIRDLEAMLPKEPASLH